jgi:predicted nucleic acid-binding protein
MLADTSVWIDHLRSPSAGLARQAAWKNLLIHPYVVAKLILGSLRQRAITIAALDKLPSARMVPLAEVRHFIELRALHGRGIGLVDVHLLASALVHPDCKLWTRDRRLRLAAEELGVSANLP